MKTGIVKWFSNTKGYGFIQAEGESDRDFFAHYSTIQMDGYRTLKAGQLVQFEAEIGEKGAHALNIRTITPSKSEDSPVMLQPEPEEA